MWDTNKVKILRTVVQTLQCAQQREASSYQGSTTLVPLTSWAVVLSTASGVAAGSVRLVEIVIIHP